MKRTILVEIEDDSAWSVSTMERYVAQALNTDFRLLEGVTVLNVEVADGTPKEAFGIGLEQS